MWQAWTNGSLGLWLIVTASLPVKSLECIINGIIVGAAAIVAGWSLKAQRPWQGWASTMIGFWLIVSLSIPTLFTENGRQWMLAVTGICLAISGFTVLADTGNS